jgi:hypothetical protein
MPTFGVVLLHDDACPHIAACARAMLQHFMWEFFDHLTVLILLKHLPPVYLLEELVGSQHFSSIEELAEGVKMWLSSQVAYKNLFFDMTSITILKVTILKSS